MSPLEIITGHELESQNLEIKVLELTKKLLLEKNKDESSIKGKPYKKKTFFNGSAIKEGEGEGRAIKEQIFH